MKIVLGLIQNFCIITSLHAEQALEKDLQSAKESILKIQKTSQENDPELNRLSSIWKQHCGSKTGDQICFIEECDANPHHCHPNHVLLFRGEEQLYSLSTTSALLRARLADSEYTRGLTLSGLLNQFERDIKTLQTFEYAPQDEPVLLSFNHHTGTKEWLWKESQEVITPYENTKTIQSTSITAYSFHVEASFLYYKDEQLKKNVGIDPLISVTSNPNVARSFSEESTDSINTKTKGRVVVLSVPKSSLVKMCSPKIKLHAGTILDPRSCNDTLNEHTDEQELDVVLYPRPDWIYKVFITH